MCLCFLKEFPLVLLCALMQFLHSTLGSKFASGHCFKNDNGNNFFLTKNGFLQCNDRVCPPNKVGNYPLCHVCCAYKPAVDVNAGLICMDKWLAYTPSVIAFIIGILLTILVVNRKSIMKFIRVKILRQQKSPGPVAYNKSEVDDHTTLLEQKIIDDDLENQNKPEIRVEINTDTEAEPITDSNDTQALNDTQIESTIQSQAYVVLTTNVV